MATATASTRSARNVPRSAARSRGLFRIPGAHPANSLQFDDLAADCNREAVGCSRPSGEASDCASMDPGYGRGTGGNRGIQRGASPQRRRAARLAAPDPQRARRAAHVSRARSSIAAARGRRWRRLPDLARRGGATRPGRICSRRGGRARARRARASSASPSSRSPSRRIPRPCAAIADPPPLIAVHGNVGRWRGRRSPSSARATPRPPASASPSGSRATSARPASRSCRGWRAGSMRPRIARASPPARSRCSPAATIASIRSRTSASPRTSCATAPRSPRCRSAGSRGRATFPAATA